MSRTSTREPGPSPTPADPERVAGKDVHAPRSGPAGDAVLPRLLDKAARERAHKARAIVKACAHIFADDPDPVDHGDLLYDEVGLPR